MTAQRNMRIASLLFLLLLVSEVAVSERAAQPQIRTPATEGGQPSNWPQLATHHLVDMTQLRSEAQELAKMANAIPDQVEQVAKGQLPKDLAENLKRIEKLSKRIRTEVSP